METPAQAKNFFTRRWLRTLLIVLSVFIVTLVILVCLTFLSVAF